MLAVVLTVNETVVRPSVSILHDEHDTVRAFRLDTDKDTDPSAIEKDSIEILAVEI